MKTKLLAGAAVAAPVALTRMRRGRWRFDGRRCLRHSQS